MSLPKDPLAAYKAQAKLLRVMLAADGITVAHSAALERTARLHGDEDWNTLCARVKNVQPMGDSSTYGDDIGTWTVCDWQQPEEIKEGATTSIDFSISVEADGINIGSRTDEGDFRGLKLELQDGAIRVMVYDERVSESPAILKISETGYIPIEVDLQDHKANAIDFFPAGTIESITAQLHANKSEDPATNNAGDVVSVTSSGKYDIHTMPVPDAIDDPEYLKEVQMDQGLADLEERDRQDERRDREDQDARDESRRISDSNTYRM
jgi:hypothetical protein